MTPEDETWLPIPGYEGFYEASDQGRVRSVERRTQQADYMRRFPARMLSVATRKDGYRHVGLSKRGVVKTLLIHRLVCMTFHGLQPDWAECIRHLDGDRSNNAASNLRWGTYTENAADMISHGNNWQLAKTHCPKGHPYSGNNLRVDRKKTDGGGYRYGRSCRVCHNESAKRRRVPIPRKLPTHCPKGHAYMPDNFYETKTRAGGVTKICKTCSYDRTKIRRAALRAKGLTSHGEVRVK